VMADLPLGKVINALDNQLHDVLKAGGFVLELFDFAVDNHARNQQQNRHQPAHHHGYAQLHAEKVNPMRHDGNLRQAYPSFLRTRRKYTMESAGYPTPAHSAKAIRGPTPQSSPMPATATAHSGS